MVIRRTASSMIQSHMGEQIHSDLVDAIELLTGGVTGVVETIQREDGCKWARKAATATATGAIEWMFRHPDAGTLGVVTHELVKCGLTGHTKVRLVCSVYLPGTHGKKPLCHTGAHGNTLEEVLHNAEFFIRVKTASFSCWQSKNDSLGPDERNE